jgi:glucosyl-3-phosphoglycerate phosphatase
MSWATMTTSRVILVRHGATDWNKDGRLLSTTDLELSAIGRAEAAQVAQRLANVRIDRLWSSPLARARQTASVIAETGAPHAVRLDERLREVDFGRFEGLTSAAAKETDGVTYARWRAGDPVTDGSVEDYESGARRGSDVLADACRMPGTTVIVSHGVLTRLALAASVLGIPLGRMRALRFDNGRMAVVDTVAGAHRLTAFNTLDLPAAPAAE